MAPNFQMAVKGYLLLLRGVNDKLLYPDDIHAPREF